MLERTPASDTEPTASTRACSTASKTSAARLSAGRSLAWTPSL